MNDQAVFGIKQASEYLNLNEKYVRQMLGRGELVGWRTSEYGTWKVSRAECDRWIEQKTQQARRERIGLVV